MALGRINQSLLILLILSQIDELKLWNNICRSKVKLLNKNYKLNKLLIDLGLELQLVIMTNKLKCASRTRLFKKKKVI